MDGQLEKRQLASPRKRDERQLFFYFFLGGGAFSGHGTGFGGG
jgi:hypothetical protein